MQDQIPPMNGSMLWSEDWNAAAPWLLPAVSATQAIEARETETMFEELIATAAMACGTEISILSLLGADGHFIRAAMNLSHVSPKLDSSFCRHTSTSAENVFVVEDALADPRFATDRFVVDHPHIRFYAGTPILGRAGEVLGTLGVLDKLPRTLTDVQRKFLNAIARQGAVLLNRQHFLELLKNLDNRVRTLDEDLHLTTHIGQIGLLQWSDRDRTFVLRNQEVRAILGLAELETEVPEVDFLELLIVPAERDSLIHGLQNIGQAGQALTWTGQVRKPSGSLSRVALHGRSSVTAQGSVVSLAMLDTTHCSELERQLSSERDGINAALIVSKASAFELAVETGMLTWSGLSPLGRARTELPSLAALLKAIHPEDRGVFNQSVKAEAAAHDDQNMLSFRACWPDGGTHWMQASVRFISREEGIAQRVVGVFVDTTDRRAAEEAIIRAEKIAAVGRLASTMSHELNNPLESLVNLLFLVQSSTCFGDTERQYLALAERELARVSQISSQVLEIHPKKGVSSVVDVTSLIGEILTIFGSRLENAGITPVLRLEEQATIAAQPADVRQLLIILVANAYDAMRRGGSLHIRCKPRVHSTSRRAGFSITVADTGIGIPAETQPQIFEAFFSTKGDNGTGLGLWTARRIVQNYKGHIAFKSRATRSSGTVFRMWLPQEA